MKRGANRGAAGILLALLAAWILAVLGAGCKVSQPYEQAEQVDDMPAPSQAVPAYRLPEPPISSALPPAAVTPVSTPPVFLDRLEDRASSQTTCKYSLDERYRRYHRYSCPYGPKQMQGHDLAVQGTDLAHRPTMRSTGTHMSRAQIKAKGYRPCQHCRPDLDEPPTWYRGEAREYRERQAVPFSVHGSGRLAPPGGGDSASGQVGGYYGDAPPRGTSPNPAGPPR